MATWRQPTHTVSDTAEMEADSVWASIWGNPDDYLVWAALTMRRGICIRCGRECANLEHRAGPGYAQCPECARQATQEWEADHV